jgi:serine/threonine protein kinase
MSLSAGSRLGQYEILSLIGAGGMGEVYRAKDPAIGREVAIDWFNRQETRSRCFAEIALSVLHHYRVVLSLVLTGRVLCLDKIHNCSVSSVMLNLHSHTDMYCLVNILHIESSKDSSNGFLRCFNKEMLLCISHSI